MQGFEPVTLTWKGQSFTIPADRQLMLIAQIEDALESPGVPAVVALTREGGPSYSRLARAFGAALRHAGCEEADDQEIYLSMMADFGRGDAQAAIRVQGAIMALLSIVAPPIAQQVLGDVRPGDAAKKPPAATDAG